MSRTPRPSKSNVAQRPPKILELPVPPTHRREPALLLISFILMLIGGRLNCSAPGRLHAEHLRVVDMVSLVLRGRTLIACVQQGLADNARRRSELS